MRRTIDRAALPWLSPGTQFAIRTKLGRDLVFTLTSREGPAVWLMPVQAPCNIELVLIATVAEWLQEGALRVYERPCGV